MAGITRVNPGNRFVEFSRDETEQSIAERFENQVRKNPRQIAVQTGPLQLTYDDLNKLANRLARVLLRESSDDRPIAILMEHDAPAVVAIFGALKASKIFILLDTALPRARIGQILSDSGANLVVTNDRCLGTALELRKDERRIVNLDCLEPCGTSDNIGLKISPERISYILFTSGSTGKPKGVIRTHRNDLQNIRNRTNTLCISDDDRMTLLGSYSTGQGMANIYSALLNGATLYPRNLRSEGFNGLADWLIREKITLYHSAATLFRHFVGELSSHVTFPELRVVNIGGEPVSWKDVALYKKYFSDNCVLVNEISCSEASTFGQFILDKQAEIRATVPVGYPIDEKEVLILDDHRNKLPPGEIGEIAIRSRFLSPGYWNRPDLTDLAFISDTESKEHRIYLTGDLGRQSADGCLEHLGRKDTRVKIRGYRVECYEIELVLLQNPNVRQAFVTHRQDARDETHLVAYVVCVKGTTLTVRELRADLVARFPEYMVPTTFVFIDTLPLTPTGKIDRRALPEPTTVRSPLDVPFVNARDPIEQSVAKLCSQILGVSVIGVHDNLVDLGGNSLAAMQIVARITKTFRVNVSLQRFYEAPTIAGLSAIIATSPATPEVPDDKVWWQDLQKGHLPLSYFQERLWFLEQWEPGKPTYNICQAFHLDGPLNLLAMEESLNTVVDRHEILRTSFGADEGRPYQVIAPASRLSLATFDLRTVPEAEKSATDLHLAPEEVRLPFDLGRAPLLRALLIKVADEEHVLVLTVHQMVCDGWSMRILLSEFWTSYEATCRDKPPPLPTLFAQYSDFAIWQRQLLTEDWLQSHIVFWQETLKGTLPVLALPTDYPRPALESFRGSRVLFVLPEPLTESLNELARRQEATLFITLMAAFKTLLYRYSRQQDLIVGFPVANRHWGEATSLIGFFVNTLVARTVISGELTFSEFLLRVRDVCHAAYDHQDLPFEKLVEFLQPPRDLSRNPVFQAMFTFQNMPLSYSVPSELCSTPVSIDTGSSKVDLTLSLEERDSRLTGFFEYSTDLFNRDRIERMAGHFQTLLEALVTDPDQPIATLPILTDAERRQILLDWNNTAADYSKDKCIHQLFEEQVERTPEAIALEFDGQEITYQELNHRANLVAHYLIGLGIGPEKLVGICVERSIEMVVGLLGILKAGGAYVPLDANYPKGRLRFIMQDAQLSVLLTQEKLADDKGWRIEDGGPRSSIFDPWLKVVFLDRDVPIIEGESIENPVVQINSNNLVYVIYTSGSTGQPKGVEIQHQSLSNCFSAIGKQINLMPKDAWLAVTTIAFDIAALELFLPLITGAKVILANRDESVDAELLCRRLKASRATVMQATPSMWKLLLDAGWERPGNFKILCGGEAMSRDLAEALLTRGEVWNLYGPTESTIWSTIHKVGSGEGPVLIGRPIANTNIYILDSLLQPVPIGVHGDLYIGGDGLARGYWNNPELTAERFVPHPFSDQANARLYRTGDRARYRSDGTIEFLGRTDNQVKIRGHRIELGEIESVLMQHSAVNQIVVVAFDEFACDSDNPQSKIENPKSLAAYVVPAQPSAPSVSELRRFLQEKLPDYMVPSSFVFLNALPLTANGKLDRNALPPPDGERPLLDQGFSEPRTEIEELVSQVWREMLKRDKIGVCDNFFDLGGHSLLATRVVARLQSTFHVDLALRKLFELPTVAGLAQHIDGLRHSGAGAVITSIVPVPRNQPLFLSFSQRRLWYLQKVDANLSAYNIPAYFRIRGDLDVVALEQALNASITRHEVFRSGIFEYGGQPHQEIVPTLQFALPVVDLSHLPYVQAEPEAKRLASEDARQLHVLDKPPLMRAKLVKLADADHVFILNFHHIIADGSSLAIFYRELAVLYSAALDAKAAALPQLPVQYADYAAWQHEWLKSNTFDAQLAYWKRQLAGLPVHVEFPADFDRPTVSAYRGARLTQQLSEELTESLKTFSRKQGATAFMTLFATFNILLSRISDQDDIVIGSTIAGRNRPETDGLIGFFINALPLRNNLSGDPSFTTLLHRVREVCLDAYTNQEMPFEKIIEELKPPRHRGRNPVFDILFNIADTSERSVALPGCEVTKFSQAEPGAKFDIVLHAPEVDGKIELAIVYNADLFRESRINLLLEQFAFLLEQFINNPDQAIRQPSLVTETYRAALPDPTEALDATWALAIHEHLAEQAQRSSDKLAVVDSEQSWTYSEIDQASNQLAQALNGSGIQPKDIVAIYARRSSSLVIAISGILKAGASFLILDPAYPMARTIDYLRIAQPKGWLQLVGNDESPQELVSCLENLDLHGQITLPQAKVELLQTLSGFADSQVEITTSADDPAYVAFTSGSTGEPKGVLCRHGPITHFLPWQKEAFELTENDRFAMLSGLAYSHLHRDVFTAIYLGSTIYIPSPSEARSPDQLVQWLERNSITVLHLTPALGQLLLTAAETRLPSVRRVFFGGDVLTMDEVVRVRRLAPNAIIGSFYGATETQRAVGYYEIPADFAANSRDVNRIPLGRGIKDVQLLLLNRAGKLAGVGEVGELYVRSHHLAQGYLNDETRTREVFIRNPFTNDPEDRLYKTGELARYLPDGNVEWAGRNDRRVNIRGFRVELGEIEAVLKKHPTVKNAAVILKEFNEDESDNPKPVLSQAEGSKNQNLKSDPQLVAYVAADEDQRTLADLLHGYVSTRLPDHMVPAHFVILEHLPLGPNGKVDYRVLPAVQQFLSTESSLIRPPRNEVEAKLAVIFSEVLGREQVGIDENFFRLGGHSLLAAQAAARIREAFGVGLELRTFLETPTVAALAKKIQFQIKLPDTAPSTRDTDREEIGL